MKQRSLFLILFILCSFVTPLPSLPFNQDLIPVTYQLLNKESFDKVVVGNTIVGVTRNSHSLYLLYFAPLGNCELWKQNQIYPGSWWTEKDTCGRTNVRAIWPDYQSSSPKSIFSTDNPKYGSATSVWYYVDIEQPDTLILATEKFRTPLLIIPGRSFP